MPAAQEHIRYSKNRHCYKHAYLYHVIDTYTDPRNDVALKRVARQLKQESMAVTVDKIEKVREEHLKKSALTVVILGVALARNPFGSFHKPNKPLPIRGVTARPQMIG